MLITAGLHGDEPAGAWAASEIRTWPVCRGKLVVFRSEVAEGDAVRGVMVGSPAIMAGQFGKGRVMCFSPHPDQTKGLEEFVRRGVRWVAGEG